MNRRIVSVFTAIMLLFVSVLPVFAEGIDDTDGETAEESKQYIVDNAYIMELDDEKILERTASRMFAAYGYDTVVYTFSDSEDEKPQSLSKRASSFIKEHTEYNAGMLLIIRASDEPEMLVYSFGSLKEIFDEDIKLSITESVNVADGFYRKAEIFQQRVQYYFGVKGIQSAFELNEKPLRLIDNADLLKNSEERDLLKKLDEVSERHSMDVVVVTEKSTGGRASEYADDFFDYNGYGMGDNYDGILLLIAMDDRACVMSTSGLAIDIFTDAGQGYIWDEVVDHLGDDDYYKAFDEFVSLCDDFAAHYNKKGKAYDVNDMPKGKMPVAFYLFISLAVGAVVGFITATVYKGQLKSVYSQTNANQYVRSGSLNINDRRDIFLYHVVNRRKLPENDGPSRSGHNTRSGGGSDTHTSSSGRTHGGSTRHF